MNDANCGRDDISRSRKVADVARLAGCCHFSRDANYFRIGFLFVTQRFVEMQACSASGTQPKLSMAMRYALKISGNVLRS